MARAPKTNKPRGPVKLDTQSGSPVISTTANPERAPVNQMRGPTVGNQGRPEKQRSFLEEKTARTSYFGELADMVTRAFARRGEEHRAYTNPALEPVSAVTRVRRGPQRGNT